MRRVLIAIAILATTAVPSFADPSCSDNEGTKPGSMGGMMQQRPDMKKEMMRNPQHLLVMAYHKNVIMFGKALERVARQGETVPAAFARSAIAEMRRSTDEMEKHRAEAMGGMPAGMGAEMQKRMNEHLVNVKAHLRQLEEIVKSDRIPSAEVLKHLQFLSEGCGAMDTGKPCCDGQGHEMMSGCGCGNMMQTMPERRQKMEEMTQRMKAQDAELAAEVEKMKRASKDRKLDLLSDIVARLVQQRADLTAQREKMHMMHGCGGHHRMHHGGTSMAPPPMMGGMDGQYPDEDEDSDLNMEENAD